MSTKPNAATPPPAVRMPDPENPADREMRNPWFRWLMHLGVPMTISLIVHASLLAILALSTWQILKPKTDVGDYEAGIAESLADQMAGAFKWPDQELKPLEEQPPQPEESLDLKPPDVTTNDANNSGDSDGFGQEGAGSGIIGTGSGGGDGSGFGGGGGVGARSIGRAGMWDVSLNANRIVYVIDFSGSILVAVDDLKRALKFSVGKLMPSQSFNVIVFYSTSAANEKFMTESFAPNLQSATPETKRAFFTWIDGKAPSGSTEPLPAVKRALTMNPEAIFFFSDGYFEETVVGEITKLNRALKAKFACFVFNDIYLQDASGLMPSLNDGAKRLQRISEQNNGKFKVVTGLDLRK